MKNSKFGEISGKKEREYYKYAVITAEQDVR